MRARMVQTDSGVSVFWVEFVDSGIEGAGGVRVDRTLAARRACIHALSWDCTGQFRLRRMAACHFVWVLWLFRDAGERKRRYDSLAKRLVSCFSGMGVLKEGLAWNLSWLTLWKNVGSDTPIMAVPR